jgi:hypothetical protein
MGFFKRIVDTIFGSSKGEVKDAEGIYFYVKCSRCGAPVRVRANRRYDLQRDDDSAGYILRKEVMDGTCFQLMQATIRYDPGYRVVDREIEGGEFIEWEEYQELTAPQSKDEEDATGSGESPE